MPYQVILLLLFLQSIFVHCTAWDFMVHLEDEDQLLCHACRGDDCAQLSKFDKTTVVCDKKTQLCWVRRNLLAGCPLMRLYLSIGWLCQSTGLSNLCQSLLYTE